MNKNYEVFIFSSANLSHMRPVVWIFNIGAGTNFIRAYVLTQTWLESIRQRDFPEFSSVPDTEVKVF